MPEVVHLLRTGTEIAYCGLAERLDWPIPKDAGWCDKCMEIAGKEDDEEECRQLAEEHEREQKAKGTWIEAK